MGHLLHSNAKTTPRIRKEIQESKESIETLKKRYSINHKTVLYWKHNDTIYDKKSGPKNPRSTVLTEQEEQIICEFRRVTKFSLDDVYICLIDLIPKMTRSNLHRCLQRHGLSRLPKDDSNKPSPKRFKDYDIGYVHIDISELYTEQGKSYMFVAIDRVCKYCYIEIYESMTQDNACIFLRNVIADFPFKIHTILTDNGSQFTYELLAEHLKPKDKTHPFDKICLNNNTEHRLTKFRHPWTNGQVEVMNKIIKQHTVKNYHYETMEQLKKHIMSFLLLYNFQRKLKSVKYQTPYDIIMQKFNENPDNFIYNPVDKIVGLNI